MVNIYSPHQINLKNVDAHDSLNTPIGPMLFAVLKKILITLRTGTAVLNVFIQKHYFLRIRVWCTYLFVLIKCVYVLQQKWTWKPWFPLWDFRIDWRKLGCVQFTLKNHQFLLAQCTCTNVEKSTENILLIFFVIIYSRYKNYKKQTWERSSRIDLRSHFLFVRFF